MGGGRWIGGLVIALAAGCGEPAAPEIPQAADRLTEPVLVQDSRVDPELPDAVREAGVPGRVILRFLVTAEGTVEEVEILEQRPEGYGLGEAAVEAVRRWRYTPARQGSTPIPMQRMAVLDFPGPEGDPGVVETAPAPEEP